MRGGWSADFAAGLPVSKSGRFSPSNPIETRTIPKEEEDLLIVLLRRCFVNYCCDNLISLLILTSAVTQQSLATYFEAKFIREIEE